MVESMNNGHGADVQSANETSAQPIVERTDTTATYNHEFAAQVAAMGADVSADEQSAIAALPSGSALLIVRRGPNVGARFLLDADLTTVGRHPEAGIFLDDVTVSRRHVEFVRNEKSFEVKDLGSLNGTYLGGDRIAASATLRDRAEVQIGKYKLTFYASRRDLAPAAGN
ncbi:MAG: FHA domain-containing protein [Rhodoglobus sp.]